NRQYQSALRSVPNGTCQFHGHDYAPIISAEAHSHVRGISSATQDKHEGRADALGRIQEAPALRHRTATAQPEVAANSHGSRQGIRQKERQSRSHPRLESLGLQVTTWDK